MSSTTPRTNGLLLEQKWEDLLEYVHTSILRNMPKYERSSLGSIIRNIGWSVESKLVRLSLRSGNRKEQLDFVDVQAKVMLKMIRLGIRLGVIPEKRYKPVSEKLVEIGKIVGGLKKVS